MTSLPAKLLIAPIRFYQRFITPYTPATCRYYPTCSAYAVSALRTHGAIVGTGLTVWRLLRCNPWSSGGIDYVPARGELWHRHAADVPGSSVLAADVRGTDVLAAEGTDAERPADRPRERDAAAASSSTVCSAEHRSAGTDCDAPLSAARHPMIGRSAA